MTTVGTFHVVILTGGPLHGRQLATSPAIRARGYYAVTGDGLERTSNTPIFDAAIGCPSADGAAGSYRPTPGEPDLWTWHPNGYHR